MLRQIAIGVFLAVMAGPPAAEENLLVNGGFEQWSDGEVAGWRISELNADGWHTVNQRPSDEREEGRLAMTMPTPEFEPDGFVILVQPLPAEKIQLGRTMVVELDAKADGANQLHFVIAFDNRGTREKIRLQHPGNDAWEELRWMFDVPPTADPDSFVVEIFNKPGGSKPALVDDAQIYFEEIEPQYELPEKAAGHGE